MKHLLVALFIAALALVSASAKTKAPKGLAVGDEAPAFTLKNYDGKEVALKDLEKNNKYTVIMFISTECPVSNGYNERMVKLYDVYSKKGVAIVGINANKEETVDRIAEHSKDKGFQFPVLKDVSNKIADLYFAQVTPETFVINAKGTVVYHGRIDDNRNPEKVTSHDLSTALDALLAGKSLTSNETKAFGCSIKRVAND
jgi:peroxiredoxin